MNLTYVLAGIQALWAIVGMAYGWLDIAVGTPVLLTALAVFGARKAVSTANPVAGVKGIW